MPKKRKILIVDEKCRVCLSDEGCMSDIYSEELKEKIHEFGKSISAPIEDDDRFPRNICHICLYKLEMWNEFKEQFVRSNAMLREHLEIGALLENATCPAKRKHEEPRSADGNSAQETNAKKQKPDIQAPSTKEESIQDIEIEKPADITAKSTAVEPLPKSLSDLKSEDVKEESEITSDVIPAASSISPKAKATASRRAKTTQRRKESTRRWVARKKALLAATGENDTDTDSMASDDEQLSPVQKARAKCNAEKVIETHRMMTKALHNLENDISGYYKKIAASEGFGIQDSDSEARKEKINCLMKSETQMDAVADTRQSSKTTDASLVSRGNDSSMEKPKDSSSVSKDFVPHSVRSELVIGGATFVVTSTLVLSEPHYLNPTQTNNSATPSEEANQERNTDIIDAVQLRRVSPNKRSKSESKLVDTCLNIEVEGTELEALQRVQSELANFVERDLGNKLVNENAEPEKIVDARVKDAFQTLDQQLKTIVEKTIKKNLENSRSIESRGNNTFAGEFLKAALRSKIFQPRVVLTRCNVDRIASPKPRTVPIVKPEVKEVEASAVKSAPKKIEEIPPPLGKRRSVQPAKYADYNVSTFDSDKEEPMNEVRKTVSGPKSSKVKTYGPATTRLVPIPVSNQHKIQKSLLIAPKPANNQKPSPKTPSPLANNSTGEKHICGICGVSIGTRKEVEIHFATHKKQVKQKMMRCKRCHEIVEARYVKLHVCSASKNLHKCRSCSASFRNEQLLVRHEESHKSEKERKPSEVAKSVQVNPHSSKVTPSNEKSSSILPPSQNRETYTCFVCDKTFTDEELLKDHLQKHCDDMSEDERNNAKDYQCAICGESLDSEFALETHVEKHLFDDEDDNPNLISIGGADLENKSSKAEMHHSCGQCAETFDSEMLLMLHMQAHEEEMAIAEWERRGIDNAQEEQHICVICDDVFATEDELSEHLDVHNGNAHICLLCDKPFLTLEELQSHVNTH